MVKSSPVAQATEVHSQHIPSLSIIFNPSSADVLYGIRKRHQQEILIPPMDEDKTEELETYVHQNIINGFEPDSQDLTAVDILVELPGLYNVIPKACEQVNLFLWVYTSVHYWIIVRNLEVVDDSPLDTHHGLRQIVDSLHNHDAKLKRITWCRENGIYQIDSFMRVLPFLPLPNLSLQESLDFSRRVMKQGLEFYLTQLGVHPASTIAPSTISDQPFRRHRNEPPKIAIVQENTIYHVIYMYTKCLIRNLECQGIKHPYMTIEYGKKISNLLTLHHIVTPDKFVRRYLYLITKVKMTAGWDTPIHDTFVMDIYQQCILCIMK